MFCGPYFILSTMKTGTTTIFSVFGMTAVQEGFEPSSVWGLILSNLKFIGYKSCIAIMAVNNANVL